MNDDDFNELKIECQIGYLKAKQDLINITQNELLDIVKKLTEKINTIALITCAEEKTNG